MPKKRPATAAKKPKPRRKSTKILHELVLSELTSAKRIAGQIARRCPVNATGREDIESAAIAGLMDAADKYKPKMGPFGAYAAIRVRGSVMDYLRTLDMMGRHFRDMLKREEKIPTNVSNLGMVTGSDAEKIILATSTEPAQEKIVLLIEMKDRLVKALEGLTERQKLIIDCIYGKGLLFKEVGVILGVTEARIFQIWKEMLHKLALELSDLKDSIEK